MPTGHNKFEEYLDYIFSNYKIIYGEEKDIRTLINIDLLSANPYISWDIVEAHLDIPWNFDFLSSNPNITFTLIQSTPQFSWNSKFYSQNPNITIDIVIANPQIEWDWNGLSQNTGIGWDIIKNHLNLPWNWQILLTTLTPSTRNLFTIPEAGDRLIFLPGKSLQFASGDIINSTNISSNRLTTNYISINTTNNLYPLEINKKIENLTFNYGYLNQIDQPSSVFLSGNRLISIRTNGRIISNGEVNIDCDIRNIENISNISSTFCSNFITQTTPKQFNWINNDVNITYGYIGQDLLKLGYSNFITPITNTNLTSYTDNSNFNSPANIQYTICYSKIIPIIAINQKNNITEINTLKGRIDTLENNSNIITLMNTISSLQSTVSTLQSTISTLEYTITNLVSRMETLETNYPI